MKIQKENNEGNSFDDSSMMWMVLMLLGFNKDSKSIEREENEHEARCH